MTTTSGGKWTASKPGQKNGYANLRVHRGPENTIGLNFFLLLGPEGIGEVVVECRVLCVDLLRPKEKAQASALVAMKSALASKSPMTWLHEKFGLTAAAHAPSVDRAWMPLNDCKAGIFDMLTPSCSSPSVILKFDASITSALARAIPPTAHKAPNKDHARIVTQAIDSSKKDTTRS